MSEADPREITLSMIRSTLYSAVVSDALDAMGYREQCPRADLRPVSAEGVLAGRCRTTRWEDLERPVEKPYELELKAVDSCKADDVLIAACGGSMRSAVWGELLSTAARNRGCAGAVVDGATRDVVAIRRMGFPVFARGTLPYDSANRQRVIEIDGAVEVGGVRMRTGDLILADVDGVVVVPAEVEKEAIRAAWRKVHAENRVRDAIRGGMKAGEAYDRFGVL